MAQSSISVFQTTPVEVDCEYFENCETSFDFISALKINYDTKSMNAFPA